MTDRQWIHIKRDFKITSAAVMSLTQPEVAATQEELNQCRIPKTSRNTVEIAK